MNDGAMSAARSARLLIRHGRAVSLATRMHDTGMAYGSLVNTASDVTGSPIILISDLAWHTRNLRADPAGSLLVAAGDQHDDPLQGARVTVLGRFTPVGGDQTAVRRRFLARHPTAAAYAGFSDFNFWIMEAVEVHSVAGFGRIATLPASEVLLPERQCAAMAEAEANVLDHMNQNHADTVTSMALKSGGAPRGDWKMAACDFDGFELNDGATSVRIDFDQPATSVSVLRRILTDFAVMHDGPA